MEKPVELIWQFGPVGILVFLVMVCHTLTIKELRSAYESRNRARIRIHTTIYCVNWGLIAVAIILAFWTWNTLNVRPRYSVEGLIFVEPNDAVSFDDLSVYPRRRGEDKVEWLMSSVQPLGGKCLTFVIQRASSGQAKPWSFTIRPDYYDRTITIFAEAAQAPFPLLRVESRKGEYLKEGRGAC